MLFNNGIYDAETNTFTEEFNPDILFFGKIHHDYERVDREYMEDIYKRIFVNMLGEVQADYLSKVYSWALLGFHQKSFLFCIGTNGDNGKSTMTNIFNKICPELCGAFNPSGLIHRQTLMEDAQKNRWALLLKNKRFIFSQ